jgi:acetyl-CoA carboxylase carboxyltransferase component
MAGPSFGPDACIALPTARIAIMGPEAAINAVYFNKLAVMADDEREQFVAERRAEFLADVDLLRLASELVVDAVVEPADLRDDLIARLAVAQGKDRTFSDRLHGIPPV